jgi:hypothetical protein
MTVTECKIVYANFATSPTRVIYATSVTPAGKKNNTMKPLENGTAQARVQTESYNNIRYSVTGIVVDLQNTNSIQYRDIIDLYTMKYDGTNAPKLYVVYGDGTNLVDLDKTTVQIPVILEDFNYPIDVSQTRDGYKPQITLNFMGTR